MNPRFYCNRCGFEVFPGQTHCEQCDTKIPGFVWNQPVTGPTMSERAVEPSAPEPKLIPIPVTEKSEFAEYPRSNDPHCSKCGAAQRTASTHCWQCGYRAPGAWERLVAFSLLMLSTTCVCCGPCMIGAADSSGVAIILLTAVFLALYIWGWVWYVRRYR